MTGRTPLSPERTLRHQAVAYSPRLSATTSEEAASAVAAGAMSSGGGAVTTAPGAPGSAPVSGEGWSVDIAQASSAALPPAGAVTAAVLFVRDPVVMYSTRLWVSKSEMALHHHLAQAQHGHTVGHVEYVVQIVGDEQNAIPLVSQPADELEHLRCLCHAQGRRGLIEDH